VATSASPEGLVDSPGRVRQGEELDQDRLAAFLRERSGLDGPLEVQQFPSGYSNLTYLLRVGGRELVLRRPPFGARIATAHDMGREYRILTRLAPVYAKVPRPILYEEESTVLGAPFYLMERVTGVILRRSVPAGLALGPEAMRRLSRALLEGLADLHAVDVSAAGLADLGHPEGYVLRQVRGWSERYLKARTDEVPSLERVAAWLPEQRPPDGPPALIHNDYKYDNVVLDPDDLARIVAVLDWEMATIGDPLMDLGTTLAYWADADDPEAWRRASLSDLTLRPGSLGRAELLELYARRTGRDVRFPVFYYTYGLFKVAVIAQQIYARYRQGLTRDPRFAGLGSVVAGCGEMAWRAIEKKRIDRLTS
jgi:aminoglycoside phosphotransferase (APT) family kinase protein